jgi:peptidoglycan/xylan/chitin deacetylase (PgdA/CDA1 family)
MKRLLMLVPLLASAQSQPPAWNLEYPQLKAIVDKVRAGRDLTPKTWPNGARVAVAFSFDMDAESGMLRSGYYSPQPLSRGEYGPRVSMPRILKILDNNNIPATFFIPTVSAQLHPETIDAILKARQHHEIGVHGWVHERIADLSADEERKLTRRAYDFWTERLGHKPAGIRTPSWDFTNETLAIIRELGFRYDSSLMGDDRPYEVVAEGRQTGLVELPVEWILDDFTYYSYDRPSYAYHRMGDNDVFEIFKAEFDSAYAEHTMFLLTMHPFVSGHRSRIAQFEKLVAYIKSKPGVWFATCDQIAQASAAQLK